MNSFRGIDDVGDVLFSAIPAGKYMLVVHLSERELVIEDLTDASIGVIVVEQVVSAAPCFSEGVKDTLPQAGHLDTYTSRCYNVYMEHGKRFSVRFPLDLLETLKQFAQEDARSINAEIVWILRTYAERRKVDAQSIQVPPVSKQDY